MNSNIAPVGVFDSGIGGLSILRALKAELPGERFVYLADAAHAPYGEKSATFVRERSLAIAQLMVEQYRVKALVVACNSATACAIDAIRHAHPDLPVIGVEPPVKPALALSKTRRIGVIGTRATLESDRFRLLLQSVGNQAEFIPYACDGLATAIEFAALETQRDSLSNAILLEALCARQLGAMGIFGIQDGMIDTLVLGCTHYPFAAAALRAHTGPDVGFVEPGGPVARQVAKLLLSIESMTAFGVARQTGESLQATREPNSATAPIQLMSTGDCAPLIQAALLWLPDQQWTTISDVPY